MTESDAARPAAASAEEASGKAQGYHHGDLKNALLKAAGELLAAQDPEALSLRAVARAAGVSAAAPYHHFASKEELLSALATEGFLGLDAAMRAHVERYVTPVERLTGAGVGYVTWAQANPGIYKLMHGQGRYVGGASPELAAAGERAYATLIELVDAVAEGVPGADDGLRRAIAAASWSVVHGLAMLTADRALAPPEGVALEDFAWDVLRRGIEGMSGRTPEGSSR